MLCFASTANNFKVILSTMLKVLKMLEMIKIERKKQLHHSKTSKQAKKQTKNLLVCYLTIKNQLQHSKTSSHTSSSCLVPHTTSRSDPNIVTTSRFVQKSQNRYLPNLFNPNISSQIYSLQIFAAPTRQVRSPTLVL